MIASTPNKKKKKSKFGLGEIIGFIMFDLYARF